MVQGSMIGEMLDQDSTVGDVAIQVALAELVGVQDSLLGATSNQA